MSCDRHNYGADFKRIKSYNSPATIFTELFKPSTDSASLLVSIKKTLFDLGGGFSLGDVTKKVGLLKSKQAIRCVALVKILI